MILSLSTNNLHFIKYFLHLIISFKSRFFNYLNKNDDDDDIPNAIKSTLTTIDDSTQKRR